MVDLVARHDGERRGKHRALRFVTGITVLSLPVFERGPTLGQVEDAPARVFPLRSTVALLEGVEGGAFGLVEPLHDAGILMAVPAPGDPLDAGRREHPRVGQEPIEALLVGTVAVTLRVNCHIACLV